MLVAVIAVVVIATSVFAGRGELFEPDESVRPSVRPTAAPTIDPAIRNALQTALETNRRLAERRTVLQGTVEADPPLASDIGDQLRLINADVTLGNAAADRLFLSEDLAPLALDLEAFYDAVLDRNGDTLGTTIRRVDLYVEGGRAVIALLDRLPALDLLIIAALESGSPPTATPSPASPSPSPASASPPPTAPPTQPPSASPSAPPSIGPSPSPVEGNLVPNSAFETGLQGWQVVATSPAAASPVHEPGAGPDGSAAARIDIQTGSQARSGIVFATTDALFLSQGSTYLIDVAIRAERSREVLVSLTDEAGNELKVKPFVVDTAWKVYTFEVPWISSESQVHLAFGLGRNDAPVWFDNVVVRPVPG